MRFGVPKTHFAAYNYAFFVTFLPILFIFILFSPINTKADSALISHPARTLKNWFGAILPSPYLAVRCAQTINCGNELQDSAACYAHIGAAVTSAQMRNSRSYFLEDLEKLSKDKNALNVLKRIHRLFFTDQASKFNLWTITLKEFNGDKRKALQFLAVFFMAREVVPDPWDKELYELRNQTNQLLVIRMKSGDIEGYPPGVKPNNTGIYHFYSIGEIAAKMRDRGIHKRYASTIPFVANEAYEIVVNRLWGLAAGNEDIYTGYAGASFALSNNKERFTGADFDTFQEQYSKLGTAAVGQFLKDDLGGSESFCNDFVPYKSGMQFSEY